MNVALGGGRGYPTNETAPPPSAQSPGRGPLPRQRAVDPLPAPRVQPDAHCLQLHADGVCLGHGWAAFIPPPGGGGGGLRGPSPRRGERTHNVVGPVQRHLNHRLENCVKECANELSNMLAICQVRSRHGFEGPWGAKRRPWDRQKVWVGRGAIREGRKMGDKSCMDSFIHQREEQQTDPLWLHHGIDYGRGGGKWKPPPATKIDKGPSLRILVDPSGPRYPHSQPCVRVATPVPRHPVALLTTLEQLESDLIAIAAGPNARGFPGRNHGVPAPWGKTVTAWAQPWTLCTPGWSGAGPHPPAR